jgi:hypothetical protein
MHLISVEFDVILDFEAAFEGLNLLNVLVLGGQHHDGDRDLCCIFAVHQCRMNFCGSFEKRALSRAQRNYLESRANISKFVSELRRYKDEGW